MQEHQFLKIRQILKDWYEQNKRDLPWRNTKDAYKIWISEIILQQTRVNQGYNYYLRFIERFPNVKSLAEAEEQEVLKHWQGLGYYSRARNLHKTAKSVISEFNGKFPLHYNDILSLSGIGEYTAAAISSFAYNQPYAAVDGNIFRVLSRLVANETPIDTSKGKKEFTGIAKKLLDKNNPGTHNQAIMEFGAMYCTPKNPDCENCPLKKFCKAYKLNVVELLPIKQGKTKVTNRYFNYFFIKKNEFTYLQKRTAKDIWLNLYELPLIETDSIMTLSELTQTDDFKSLFKDCNFIIEKTSRPYRHVLSHRIIHAVFYTININVENKRLRRFERALINELERYPISRLTELFLEGE